MTHFKMAMAGFSFDVLCIYEATKKFCREFLIEDESDSDEKISDSSELPNEDKAESEPTIKIQISQSNIDAERAHSDDKNYSDRYLEPLALYRRIVEAMIEKDVLLMHGAVLAKDGAAYMFTAKSGTGKSTHGKLWLENVPGSYFLNGDKPLLKCTRGQVLACGTPWRGKEGYGVNEILPLKAITILERGETNEIHKISFSEAFNTLFAQIYRFDDPLRMAQTLKLLENIGNNVTFYRLKCNMAPGAALVSAKAILGTDLPYQEASHVPRTVPV